MRAAACLVIQDFNQGMIPFYIKPPKYMLDHMQFCYVYCEDRNQGLQIVNDWSQGFDFKSINDENMHAIQIAENAFDVSIIVGYESIG